MKSHSIILIRIPAGLFSHSYTMCILNAHSQYDILHTLLFPTFHCGLNATSYKLAAAAQYWPNKFWKQRCCCQLDFLCHNHNCFLKRQIKYICFWKTVSQTASALGWIKCKLSDREMWSERTGKRKCKRQLDTINFIYNLSEWERPRDVYG